ncbi:hypothetical protein ABZ667_16130 [Streptomyces lavendulae]|uniref:hypothetical protein n=1 Tax=Streptomyces lavendulae TaxID=1914 RepID=UPI0033E148AB
MAIPPLDLADFKSLMGLFTSGHGALALDLYNACAIKAGQPTASGVDSVVLTPSSPSATVSLEAQVVTRVKAAIAAAS